MLSLSTSLLGEEINSCFHDHVKDAMDLNRERRELYSKVSQGESEKVSRYLIIWEKIIILKAKKFDRRARKYQRLGIPFMCEDFVDMKLTPNYTDTTQIPSAYNLNYKPISKLIKKTLKTELSFGYQPFIKQLNKEITKLEKNGAYDCLLRHLLESLVRTADLAPRYLAKAPQQNRRKFNKLINKYLRLQIFGIGQAVFIDRKARSLQAKGLPILCNDVPAVHLSPWQ